MTEEADKTPSLPTYSPPHTGPQLADPRQTKPLFKMMRSLLKPKKALKTSHRGKWKHEYPYY